MRRLLIFVPLVVVPLAARAQVVSDMIDVSVTLSHRVTTQTDKTVDSRFASNRVDTEFTGIAVQGFAEGDSLRGWVQFESSGPEREWLPLYIVRSATDAAFLAAYRGQDVRARVRFTLRFTVTGETTVRLIAAGVFDQRKDVAPPDGESVEPQDAASFLVLAPQLWDRDAWQAAPFRGTPIPLNRPSYDNITLHHTAGFSAVTLAQGLEQVRLIQDFHQNGRGWRDIGYHFLMDQEGRLYQGRPFLIERSAFRNGPPLVHGAHVGGANTGNIGVSLMGCYHPPESVNCQDVMTVAARDSLVVTFGYLAERYDVSTDHISGHRDFNATACPGDNNYADLPALRWDTDELLRTGNSALGTASFVARTDDVGVVTIEWDFLTDNGITDFRIERITDTSPDVIFSAHGAESGTLVDHGAAETGTVSYTLTVQGSRFREQVLGRAVVEIPTPSGSTLAGNFPNPFRDQTTIRYFLEQPGIVTLSVYDATGRRVASLEDIWRDENMWHAAAFDAGGLPGGVYYYQVQVKGFAGVTYNAARPLVVLH